MDVYMCGSMYRFSILALGQQAGARLRYALWTEVRNWFKCLRNWQQNGFFNFIFNVYI